MIELLVVASEADPVARAALPYWGTPESIGEHVEGVPIRRLSPSVGLLRRPELHIHDEHLDRRLSTALRAARPTLVFPSIHRSERGDRCFTVHPLGNLGDDAEVGGSPRAVVPSDGRRMTDALRRLDAVGHEVGLPATFEATHHGPALELRAFFAEIGYGDDPAPPERAVRRLAEVLPEIQPSPEDRLAVGVGGGHYAPHFTDLALKRRWSFGHLISRHALAGLDVAGATAVRRATEGAAGAIFARAADAATPVGAAFGPRLAEGEAARRAPPAEGR